jgi:formate dehydrogenase major subunit
MAKAASLPDQGWFVASPGILSSTFHFPEMMLNLITRSPFYCFAVHRLRCSVSDSLAMCPEYKVVSCRIRKARKTHLREAGVVVAKA